MGAPLGDARSQGVTALLVWAWTGRGYRQRPSAELVGGQDSARRRPRYRSAGPRRCAHRPRLRGFDHVPAAVLADISCGCAPDSRRRATRSSTTRTWLGRVSRSGTGGKKIPEPVRRSTERRITAFAAEHYAGRYRELAIRFHGQFCYVDAFVDPEPLPPDWTGASDETAEECQARLRDTPPPPMPAPLQRRRRPLDVRVLRLFLGDLRALGLHVGERPRHPGGNVRPRRRAIPDLARPRRTVPPSGA